MRITNAVFALAIIFSTFALSGCDSSSNSATNAPTNSVNTTNPSNSASSPAQEQSVDQIKAGITEMLSTTNQLKQAIDAGDQVKVKSTGPKLEETWKTIEDGVKPRSSDLYDKVEASLNPEVAGSQAGQLDKQMLGKLNDQLTQTLNELLKKI